MNRIPSTSRVYVILSSLFFAGVGFILLPGLNPDTNTIGSGNHKPSKVRLSAGVKPVQAKFAALPVVQSAALNFSFCPNLAPSGALTLHFKNVANDNILVKIIDLVGKEVFSQNVSVTSVENFVAEIDLPGKLPIGAYFVKVECNNSIYTKMVVLRKGA